MKATEERVVVPSGNLTLQPRLLRLPPSGNDYAGRDFPTELGVPAESVRYDLFGSVPVDAAPLFWYRWITGHQISFVLWRAIADVLVRHPDHSPPPDELDLLTTCVDGYSAMLLYSSTVPRDHYHTHTRVRMALQHPSFSGAWAPDYRPTRRLFRGRVPWQGDCAALDEAVDRNRRMHDHVADHLVPDGRSLLQASAGSTTAAVSREKEDLYDNFFLTIRRPVSRAEVRAGAPESIPEAAVEIDVLPPSLTNFAELPWTNGEPEHRLAMRYGAFNGAADVPGWLLGERKAPRIVLTCGSAEAQARRGETYRRVIEALACTECEAVILSGGAVLDRLPDPLPSWVRVERWLPLKFALDHSDAIVHHAGSGTVLTSFAAGLPQVAIPMPGTVSVENARSVAACGAGTMLDLDALDTDELAKAVTAALTEPSQREAARAVRREMADMPSVRAVATRLSTIVGERR